MQRLFWLVALFWIVGICGLYRIYLDAWAEAWIAGDVSFLVEYPPTLCCFYEPKHALDI